ncbi:MAG: hypothetical protein HGB08_00160 [Candidatus Moranbacteria bacterium]|nr:hypothetical protein [Candidatus Moranbacteria bacterium]
MSRIITEEMVREGVRLAMPAIDAILAKEGTTWGPKLVMWCVKIPGSENDIHGESFGESARWTDKNWEEGWESTGKFLAIARKKLAVAERERIATSVVAATRPWCLEEGEFLYPGGVYCDGVSVAVSGAKGETDEAIAWLILNAILMLTNLDARKRIEEKQMEI